MRLRHFLLVALLFVVGLANAQQFGSIPVNKNVRQGKLSNGLTYYILRNNWPEKVLFRKKKTNVVWLTSWNTWHSMVLRISQILLY